MRLLEIREMTAPMRREIRNAYIDFTKMTASVVAVVTDYVPPGESKSVVGYGFNSNGRYAAGGLLRERFIPRVLEAAERAPGSVLDDGGENLSPERIWALMMSNEKPGGHGERSVAVGTVDMAVWDAVAKVERKPLWRLLLERYGERFGFTLPDERIWVYAAGGYYSPGKDDSALQDEMRRYLDMGYMTVKMKIGGAPLAEDVRRIEAVLKIVGKGERLAVDANGRFDLATAITYGEALAPYGLRWYEEAGDPLDYALQAVLGEAYAPPLATGENLFSVHDARNLIRYGGMRPDRDVLQFDPVLGYGLVEYLRILEMLRGHGWSLRRCVPHGGHQFALNIAAGLGLGGNESYPGIFQPFGGFADDIPVEGGYVRVQDTPGIGFERKGELYGLMRALAD